MLPIEKWVQLLHSCTFSVPQVGGINMCACVCVCVFDVTLPPPRRWEADVTLPAEEWMAPVIKIHEENRGNGEDWPGERRQQQRGVHSLFPPFFNSVAPRCSSDAFSRNTAGIHVCCCGGGGAESSGWEDTNAVLCCVAFSSLSEADTPQITVLYPSLADWSESPPYSALPRPGVEPLGEEKKNKATVLRMCFFFLSLSVSLSRCLSLSPVAHTHPTISWTDGIFFPLWFCFRIRRKKNKYIGRLLQRGGWSGEGARMATRNEIPQRRMCFLKRICWSRWEEESRLHTN